MNISKQLLVIGLSIFLMLPIAEAKRVKEGRLKQINKTTRIKSDAIARAVSKKISNGHASKKHGKQFTGDKHLSQRKKNKKIEDKTFALIKNGKVKSLKSNRAAYHKKDTVAIINLKDGRGDFGTVFNPGADYIKKLK